MSNYTPTYTNAAGVTKDATHTPVLAADIGTEFDAIQTAINSKADTASPTLVTPVLGVATATSINKVTITAPATSATLTIADGKTATINNTLTFAGTDSTTMTFPSTSATIARTDAANTFTGTQTIGALVATTINGHTFTAGSSVFTGTAGQTYTFPSTTGTLAKAGANSDITSLLGITGTMGYATGAGGTATQATDKTTTVIINKICGEIIMNAQNMLAGESKIFTVSNSLVAADDFPFAIIKSGATTNSYSLDIVGVSAGGFNIQLHNFSAGALAEAVVLSFVVLKSVKA